MDFSKAVRLARGGMRRVDLGDLIGYSDKTVEAVELKQRKSTPIFALAVALGLDKPELLDNYCTTQCPIGQHRNCGGCASAQKKDRRSAA